MQKNNLRRFLSISVLVFLALALHSQENIYMGHDADTLKTRYPYTFPIFGHFLHEIGIDLPLPVGIMVNYFHGNQPINITEIGIGFSGGNLPEVPMTDITRLIEFEEINAKINAINFRADVWILPFLSVYGLIGKTYSTTDVILSYPIKLNAVAEIEGMSYGLGGTLAGGVHGFFGVADLNWVWTDLKGFQEPVPSNTLSVRAGYAWKFKKRPQSTVNFWVGAMKVSMSGTTNGNIILKDILPSETWQQVDEIEESYYEWYNSIDADKQEIADKVFTPIVENIVNSDGSGTVSYSINKIPAQDWNMLVGGQYQLNKHFQFRAEAGFIGRTSLLLSANYRFGIKHIK